VAVKYRYWPFDRGTPIGCIEIPIDALLSRCTDDKCTLGVVYAKQYINFILPAANLEATSNSSEKRDWSMASITVKLIRDEGKRVDDLLKLGMSHLSRFNELGEQVDLDGAIASLGLVVELADDGHPLKPKYFNTLALCLMEHYGHVGELSDLEGCIENLNRAVGLTDGGHPDRAANLSCLGLTQMKRYERLGELTDIEDSISNLKRAVQLTVDGHPDKLAFHSNLGMSQLRRYQRLGELADVEESISIFRKAVQLTDNEHPNKAMFLSNLGISQQGRFDHLGNLIDIEDSVLNLQLAVDLTKDGHPIKPIYLGNLGVSQLKRHGRLGTLKDVEDSVLNLHKAVRFTEDGYLNKPMYLGNLGVIQLTRYEQLGELKDVGDSIGSLQKAVQLTEDGHPDKPIYLRNLGISQLKRYERLGELKDVEDSIANTQKAVQSTADGHPNKPMYFSNLGNSQRARFEHLGNLTDIEDSICNLQKAVHFTKNGHPTKPVHFGNLGGSQLKRYEHLDELKDVKDSIVNLKIAVQLTEDGHPDKSSFLSTLGLAQKGRFNRLGNLIDIEDSVLNLQKAVQLTQDGHINKTLSLGNLGASQLKRYERLGELKDVEDSIANILKAIQSTDDGHANKPFFLSNLGVSQRFRFDRLSNLADIKDSILNLQKAVQLTKDGHSDKPNYLGNLGVSQMKCFKRLNELKDIEDAILNSLQAAQLTEDGHPRKPNCLSNLGICQQMRYMHLGEMKDLEDAILHCQMAVNLVEQNYPDQSKHLRSLGVAQYLRFERLNIPEDFSASISAFRAAAQSKTSYPRDALSAARAWANASYRNGNLSSALDGYRTALEILPKVASLGLSAASRQDLLIREGSENLGCLAATCAIQLGRLEEAVELLDMGRSVFWQQASSLRSDLEKLREAEPELADQLAGIGQKLNAASFSNSFLEVEQQIFTVHKEDVAQERRRLVGEWEGLLDRVRELPQFEHFLRPIPFHQLRQASTGGQVIIINASELGVDAIIFGDTHRIIHVPLHSVEIETLARLACDILLPRPTTASEAQRRNYTRRHLKPVLRTVWNDILMPIFDKIQIPLNRDSDAPQQHIWWYPTGPLTFIPIHAAGPGKGETDVSRLVISSYVTTLSSLFQAHKIHKEDIMGRLKLLAVSQPNTPGQDSLPLAAEEVDNVVQVVSSAGWPNEDILHLNGSDATSDRVLEELGSSSWVHLACHGMQHPTSGMSSAFSLYDGDLELSQIASKKLSTGRLAFLSACHTAVGLKTLPGEAMHLAGGLQFAGLPSVIATMWGISDEDAPIVTSHTYKYLFRNGLQGCDPSEAATALNRAVLLLREDPKVTVDRWASFIHFGI
jgi:tetratricopeptide (TPR) repeat protein